MRANEQAGQFSRRSPNGLGNGCKQFTGRVRFPSLLYAPVPMANDADGGATGQILNKPGKPLMGPSFKVNFTIALLRRCGDFS